MARATTKPTALTVAYSYSRWSSAQQSEGDSETRQREMREAWLAAHPTITLDDSLTMTDRGLSQYSGEAQKRGELGVFLTALRAGQIKRGYLLVEAIDRLTRMKNFTSVRLLWDIVEAGVSIVTLEDGRVYSEESINDDEASITTLINKIKGAREYSDRISRRVRSVVARKQDKARTDKRPRTRMAPFGYRWVAAPGSDKTEDGHFEIIEERAQVIRRIFREAIERPGRGGIAQRLNEDKIPPFDKGGMGLKLKKPGKVGLGGGGDGWHRAMVLRILQNRAWMGEYQPTRRNTENGKIKTPEGEPIAGYYPTIIDAATFARAQALRSTVKTGGRAIRIFDNLLRGMTTCGTCGRKLHAKCLRVSGKEYLYLLCPAATKHTCANVAHHRYTEIETMVLDIVLDKAFSTDAFENHDDGVREIENQIAGVNDQIKREQKKYDDIENADWGDDGLPDMIQASMLKIVKNISAHKARIEALRTEISVLQSKRPVEAVNAVRELRAVAEGRGEGRVEARAKIHTALTQITDSIVCHSDKYVELSLGGGAYRTIRAPDGSVETLGGMRGTGERGELYAARRQERRAKAPAHDLAAMARAGAALVRRGELTQAQVDKGLAQAREANKGRKSSG